MSDIISDFRQVRASWPLRIKNGSGAELPPCSLVWISSVTITNGCTIYTVVKPNNASTDFNWDGYLVTGPWTIGSASTDEGVASNLVQPGYLRYDTGTPAKGEVFGPKHGQHTASKNYFGFEILGHNTTIGGNTVTLARWIGVPSVYGQIDTSGTIGLGSTCTVSVYTDATLATDTTMNITGVLNRGTSLSSVNGKYCKVSRAGGVPILDWVAC